MIIDTAPAEAGTIVILPQEDGSLLVSVTGYETTTGAARTVEFTITTGGARQASELFDRAAGSAFHRSPPLGSPT